jgi:hypothetical protein
VAPYVYVLDHKAIETIEFCLGSNGNGSTLRLYNNLLSKKVNNLSSETGYYYIFRKYKVRGAGVDAHQVHILLQDDTTDKIQK